MSLTIRPATLADRDFWFRLRNDPVTVKMSRTQARVLGPEHDAWFEAALRWSERALFVAVVAKNLVGTGRLDHGAAGTEVSLVIAPEARGRGHGTAMVRALVEEATRRTWGPCWAEIRPENGPSLKAFQRAGFVLPRGVMRLEWGG